MSGIVEIIQRVVRAELARRRGATLGVVTAVHPHGQDDDSNYEADVQLKHEGLELRRVPIAVPHRGAAAPPRKGDVVLVQPLDGDLNQALITARFYRDGDPSPLHDEDELLVEHRVPDGTLNHLRFRPDGSILLQRDVTKPADGTQARTSIRIAGDGNILIEAGPNWSAALRTDGAFHITCTTLTVNGDLTVRNGAGNSTTISGNEIKGA